MTFFDKAEAIITSAFYLAPLISSFLEVVRIVVLAEETIRCQSLRMRSFRNG